MSKQDNNKEEKITDPAAMAGNTQEDKDKEKNQNKGGAKVATQERDPKPDTNPDPIPNPADQDEGYGAKKKEKMVMMKESVLKTMMNRLTSLEEKVGADDGSPIVRKATKDRTARILVYQPRGQKKPAYLSGFSGVNYFLDGRKDERGKAIEFCDIDVTVGDSDNDNNLLTKTIEGLTYKDLIQNSKRIVVKILDRDIEEIEEQDGFVDAKEVPEGKWDTVKRGYKVPVINTIHKAEFKVRLPDGKHAWFDESAINV